MPRIENTNGLTLSTIVNQLELGNPQDPRELRSNGSNLYVKEEPADRTSMIGRKFHRTCATELVCQSLAAEHNMTTDQARHIFKNVFGQAPTKISASDVLKLQELGKTATRIHENLNRDFPQAFELAIGIKEFPDDVAYKEMAAQIGSVFPADVRSTQHRIEAEVSGLPPFESSSPETKIRWLDIAYQFKDIDCKDKNCLLRRLAPEQKLSLQMAVIENLHSRMKRGRGPLVQGYAALANGRICAGYNLCELIAPEDLRMLKTLLEEFQKNGIVCHGYAMWETMNREQRRKVFQTLIDLHAEKFGYANEKPTLTLRNHFGKEDPMLAGLFSESANELTVITDHKSFNDFGQSFTTVIHELTHKHQAVLVARMKQNDIDPSDPLYTRARIFALNNQVDNHFSSTAYVTRFGIDPVKAYTLYRSNPIEQVACHMADYATSALPVIFASLNTEETAEGSAKNESPPPGADTEDDSVTESSSESAEYSSEEYNPAEDKEDDSAAEKGQ